MFNIWQGINSTNCQLVKQLYIYICQLVNLIIFANYKLIKITMDEKETITINKLNIVVVPVWQWLL